MRRKYLVSGFAFLLSGLSLGLSQTTIPMAMAYGPGRIAISHDGNNWDKDEPYAMAMDYALLTAYGSQKKLVHMAHSVIWINNEEYHSQMILSADAVNRFPGFTKDKQYDCQVPAQVLAGRANFKAEAEKSSTNDILYYLLGGPMDIAYHDIEAVSKEYRKFIVCISSSNANETMGQPDRMGWSNMKKDFSADGVKFIKYDHSSSAEMVIGSNNWDFLNNMPASSLMPPEACNWLRSRDFKANGKVLDSWVLLYVLTGYNHLSVANFEAIFKAPLLPVTSKIETRLQNDFKQENISLSYSPYNHTLDIQFKDAEGFGSISMHTLRNQKIQNVPLIAGKGLLYLKATPKGKYFLTVHAKGQKWTKTFWVK